MINVSKLEKTLHKGAPISGSEEEDLYIYKDYGDGTGILTDGQNFYFSYNDLKSVGEPCPPDAKFLSDVEKIVLKNSTSAMKVAEDLKKAKPEAADSEIVDLFKEVLTTQVEIKE